MDTPATKLQMVGTIKGKVFRQCPSHRLERCLVSSLTNDPGSAR